MDTINEQMILILNEKKNYPFTSFLHNIKIETKGTIYQPSLSIIDPFTKKYLLFVDFKETISANDKIELSKKYASLKKFVFPDSAFYVIIKKDEGFFFIDFLNDPKLIEKNIEEFPPYDMIQASLSHEKEKTENDFKQRQEEVLISNKNKFLKLRNGILISTAAGLMFFLVLFVVKNESSCPKDIATKGIVGENPYILPDSISKNLTIEINSLKNITIIRLN